MKRRYDHRSELHPGKPGHVSGSARSSESAPSGLGFRFSALFGNSVSGPRACLSLTVLLLLLVLVSFAPVLRNGFINYDDDNYVTANAHVKSGLTLAGAAWAFRSIEAANWHPLTWLSHMLDCQLYGLSPWGHHLTNLLLHALTSVILFLLLRRLTGATWRSFIVAAIFGLHPLRVESVAWVSERKDVLSALFFLLTIWAYCESKVQSPKSKVHARDARVPTRLDSQPSVRSQAQQSTRFYLLALGFFALGLMSKPMLVTLPFVLLLLDYWPLQRGRGCGGTISARARYWAGLVSEKIPFFVLSAAACTVTFAAQKQGGTVAQTSYLPIGARVENALVAYGRYLGKLFWPADLAVFYPYPPRGWTFSLVAFAGILLLGLSLVAILRRRHQPYLAAGWFWFVGMLIPVIGLVQVGAQSMADRYSYLPLIGVVIASVWSVQEIVLRYRKAALPAFAAAGLAVLYCAGLTWRQTGFWRGDETLFRHALAATKDNFVAHNLLGLALQTEGRATEALAEFEAAARLKPREPQILGNFANALCRNGRVDEGIRQFERLLELKPDSVEAHHNLSIALCLQGRLDEGLEHSAKAVRLAPNSAPLHRDLAVALNAKGRRQEAIAQLTQALELQPDYFEAERLLRALKAKEQSSR